MKQFLYLTVTKRKTQYALCTCMHDDIIIHINTVFYFYGQCFLNAAFLFIYLLVHLIWFKVEKCSTILFQYRNQAISLQNGSVLLCLGISLVSPLPTPSVYLDDSFSSHLFKNGKQSYKIIHHYTLVKVASENVPRDIKLMANYYAGKTNRPLWYFAYQWCTAYTVEYIHVINCVFF